MTENRLVRWALEHIEDPSVRRIASAMAGAAEAEARRVLEQRRAVCRHPDARRVLATTRAEAWICQGCLRLIMRRKTP